MSFNLPRYTELTPEQKKLVNMPYNANIVVSGSPGTGKTVVALYRASQLCKENQKVLMLVYNRPIMKYLDSSVKSLNIKVKGNT